MTSESIDQLARRLAESLPQSLRTMRGELEQNFRSILQSGLARLDLVTREEFEIQETVLARTRAKLEALEERLQRLESVSSGAAAEPAKKAAGKKKPAKKAASKKSTKKKKTKAAPKKA